MTEAGKWCWEEETSSWCCWGSRYLDALDNYQLKATFFFSYKGSKGPTHLLKCSPLIRTFCWFLHRHDICLTFLKALSVFDLPNTNIDNFSPVALAAVIPVSLTLLFYRNISLLTNGKFYSADISNKTELICIKFVI